MTISLCMIVRNEAELLPRALTDWRALADELLIADTGSDDNTVNIATRLGARVLHYEWAYPGNKGAARNVGLDAAASEWIVILDADEIIQDAPGLRATLLEQDLPVDGLDVHFQNYTEYNQMSMQWTQLRIFRRGLFRYKHREHELPFAVGAARLGTISTVFEHRPPAGREPGKLQPMLDRLMLDVLEQPDDPHPLYFLHRQYLLAGDYIRSIELGQQFLAMPGNLDRCECYGNLANAYLRTDRPVEAIKMYHNALVEQPERRVWWIRLAEVYMVHGNYHLALTLLRCAAELRLNEQEQNYQPELATVHLYNLIEHCQMHLAGHQHEH